MRETSPERFGEHNLDGLSDVRLFQGRVLDVGEAVDVIVGEIPSGRVIEASLPLEWFEPGRPSPGQGVKFATWGDPPQRRVIDNDD